MGFLLDITSITPQYSLLYRPMNSAKFQIRVIMRSLLVNLELDQSRPLKLFP